MNYKLLKLLELLKLLKSAPPNRIVEINQWSWSRGCNDILSLYI